MVEAVITDVAVGDKVRVHFHPPGAITSYCEGVVSRVDVTTPEGRFFVVEVTHEVLINREYRITPGFQDYVRYECQNDFPGRVEVLSASAPDQEHMPAPDLMAVELWKEAEHEADENDPVVQAISSRLEPEQLSETATECELTQVDVEHLRPRRRGGLIGRLFARQN